MIQALKELQNLDHFVGFLLVYLFVCLFPVSDEIIRNWLKDLCSYFANLEKKSQILNLSDSKYFDGIPNLYYHSHCFSPPLICALPPSFPLSFICYPTYIPFST